MAFAAMPPSATVFSALTQLTPFRTRRADQLSGGMKQKLALACTLIHRPEVLLLDEPTTGVDPVSRREFWKLLSEFLAAGLTIVMATPYLDEAERCARVALLHEGARHGARRSGVAAGGAARRRCSRSRRRARGRRSTRWPRCPASRTCSCSAIARTCGCRRQRGDAVRHVTAALERGGHRGRRRCGRSRRRSKTCSSTSCRAPGNRRPAAGAIGA